MNEQTRNHLVHVSGHQVYLEQQPRNLVEQPPGLWLDAIEEMRGQQLDWQESHLLQAPPQCESEVRAGHEHGEAKGEHGSVWSEHIREI